LSIGQAPFFLGEDARDSSPKEGPTTLTLLLLVVMATIGSADGPYYHTWKFRLATHPSSRKETVTPIARGLSPI